MLSARPFDSALLFHQLTVVPTEDERNVNYRPFVSNAFSSVISAENLWPFSYEHLANSFPIGSQDFVGHWHSNHKVVLPLISCTSQWKVSVRHYSVAV